MLIAGYSCSSDDDAPDPVEETPELLGNWQLTNVDFIDVVEGGFPKEDRCMATLVLGYQFKTDDKLAIVIGYNFPSGEDLWTWEGDETGFVITQNNPAYPPYNFGLTSEGLEFVKVNGNWTMKFNSELGHGSKATFTLVKVDTINEDSIPVIKNPDGSIYTCEL